MATTRIIEFKPLDSATVRHTLAEIEKRDSELDFLGKKLKDYLDSFSFISLDKRKELYEKLSSLDTKRLKEEHIVKIIDFLPVTVDDLKLVLQSYPVSLPKTDLEAIIAIVKEFKA